MKRKLLPMLLMLCFCLVPVIHALAGTIKGEVLDAQTGEPIAGAKVTVVGQKWFALVNLDGSFQIRNIPAGSYQLMVSSTGYQSSGDTRVNISGDGETVTVVIRLVYAPRILREIQISGHSILESDHAVIGIEKNSDVIQNILSEKTIELLPDATVANALQRISGVTIQRDISGEGRYAIIRGMEQRYNTTLVNGIEIPSPDDKYRFVPMDIFPAEMVERLEVTKSLTPEMEGDAIGGMMNLVMKSAPDEFLFTANVAGGYSTLFSNRPFSAFSHSVIQMKSPAEIYGNNYQASAKDFPLANLHYSNQKLPINSNLGLTIGDRTRNGKLGGILSFAYQNYFRGSNEEALIPSAQPGYIPSSNTPAFTDAYDRRYSTQTNRVALQAKVDYVFNNRNTISLFNMFVHQNEFQTRYTPDTTIGTNSSAFSKDVDVENRSRWQIEDIYNTTLQGIHQLTDRLKLDWDAVYSIAKNQVPDMAWYDYNANVLLGPSQQVTQIDSTTYGTSMSRVWEHNTDQDWAGYANLTWRAPLFKQDVELKAGGLYRYKTRNNYYNSYKLTPTYTTAQTFHSIDSIPFAFSPAQDGTGEVTALNSNTYTVHEQVTSGYIQAKFKVTPALQVLGGVRVENTQQQYVTVMPTSFTARSGTIHYTDVLPSIHFRYLFNAIEDLRLSYFKSISRPGFGEIIPYIVPGEEFTEIGNPYLKHVRADNLDLRYGLFPGKADELLLGLFYKQLKNPIEYFVTTNGGPSAQFIQPGNVNEATNLGFEAVYTRYFGMFGISANYTYTHSQVTTRKLLYHYVQNAGAQTDSVSETRPLQGQADHVANFSILYKNPKVQLDIQLAFTYTGTLIAQVSQYDNLDIWQKPYGQIDFSLEKGLSKHFFFYLKANNLTNAPNERYIKASQTLVNQQFSNGYKIPFQDVSGTNTIVEKDTYFMNFLAGIRYRF